jgi:hypothetical protein
VLGVVVATWLKRAHGDGFEDTAQLFLGAALIASGIGLVFKTFVAGRAKSDGAFILARSDKRLAIATGIVGGFIVGLTSVGSGTFFGLVMLLAFPLTAAKVVGTDIFHAAALLWVAGASHFIAGNVDVGATAWLLLGSIPGVLAGSQLTIKLPERSLRVALGTVLFTSGLKLVDVPADAVVLPTALAAGAVLAAVAELQTRRLDGRAVPAPAE